MNPAEDVSNDETTATGGGIQEQENKETAMDDKDALPMENKISDGSDELKSADGDAAMGAPQITVATEDGKVVDSPADEVVDSPADKVADSPVDKVVDSLADKVADSPADKAADSPADDAAAAANQVSVAPDKLASDAAAVGDSTDMDQTNDDKEQQQSPATAGEKPEGNIPTSNSKDENTDIPGEDTAISEGDH